MLQKEKYGAILFSALYLFPQCLASLALLSFLAIWLSSWWLMFLCCLLFLAPLPAPWRATFEMEGYTASMLVYYETYGSIPEALTDYISKHFYSMDYFLMWPFKNRVKKKINRIGIGIRRGLIKGYTLNYPS